MVRAEVSRVTTADCPESEDGRNTGHTEQILEDIEKFENSIFRREMDTGSSSTTKGSILALLDHHFDYISEYGISASCGESVLGSLSVAVGGQEASGDRKLNQQMQDLLSLMEVYVAVQT